MFRINPIRCGTLTLPKDATTYLLDRDVSYTFPVYVFLLTAEVADDDTVILVDTGVESSDSAFMRRNERTVGSPGGGPEPIIRSLSRHGLAPADVDTVVLTHLHHDHAANSDSFPDAEFVVQRSELESARDPLPPLAGTYHGDHLRQLDELTVTVLNGDHRLHEDIELLETPGHSAGMQTIVVETTAGRHAIIADLAYSRHNLDPSVETIVDAAGDSIRTTPATGEYVPPGIHIDIEACYESVDRVRERIGEDGVLLSSHDPEVSTAPYPR